MTKLRYNFQMTLAEKMQYAAIKSQMKFIMMTNQYDFNHLPIVGEKVLLIPEPLNKKDPKAIAIYNLQLEKMGYLTNQKKINEFVFDFLNGRTPAFGYVKSIENKSTSPLYILNLTHICDWL